MSKRKVIELTGYAIDRVVIAREGELILVNYTEGVTRPDPEGKEVYQAVLGNELRLCKAGLDVPLENLEEATPEELAAARQLYQLICARLEREYQEAK